MSDWYYALNNEQKGPINESELKADFATNKLPPDTLVWKDGMESWTPANQVPAFVFRPPPTAAKLPTPPAAAAGAPAVPAAAVPAASAPSSSTTPVDLKQLKGMLGTPESLEVTPEDAEKNKVFGILAYIGILFLVPLLAAKDSPFAKYHANQGLVLFLAAVALSICISIIEVILGIVGVYFLDWIFSVLFLLFMVGLIILGIINAAAGKCVPLPVIGGIKIIK